jgi:hypothetical protein
LSRRITISDKLRDRGILRQLLKKNWKSRRAQINASPVSIAEAVRLAKGTAALIGQFTGGDYGEPARRELNAGESLAEEGLGNPVAFAHTIIDWYALSTGDLLHGTAEVSREGHGLAFSPSAVVRAACEYAQITSWLAEPDISLEVRMAGQHTSVRGQSGNHVRILLLKNFRNTSRNTLDM